MPYAPEPELEALVFQWLSLVHSLSRHGNWSMPNPALSISEQPTALLPLYSLQELGIEPEYGTVLLGWAATAAAFFVAAVSFAAARFAMAFFSSVRALAAASFADAAAFAAASLSAWRCQARAAAWAFWRCFSSCISVVSDVTTRCASALCCWTPLPCPMYRPPATPRTSRPTDAARTPTRLQSRFTKYPFVGGNDAARRHRVKSRLRSVPQAPRPSGRHLDQLRSSGGPKVDLRRMGHAMALARHHGAL